VLFKGTQTAWENVFPRMITDIKELQLLKESAWKTVMFGPMIIWFSAVHLIKQLSFMNWTESGRSMRNKEVQEANACAPIPIKCGGRVINGKLVQKERNNRGIMGRSGNVKEISDLQSSKTSSATFLTDGGTSNFTIDEHN
jgi:hypothetical protein